MNPIFQQMMGSTSGVQAASQMINGTGGNNFNNLNDFIGLLNQRYGSMQNALGALDGMLRKRGTNPKAFAMQLVRGKHFTKEQAQQIAEFTSTNGATQQEISEVLSQTVIN